MSSQTDLMISCYKLNLTVTLEGKRVVISGPDSYGIITDTELESIAAFNLYVETMKDAQRAINNQVDRPTPSQASPRLSDLITPHSEDSDPDGDHPHLRMEDC